MSPKSAKTPTSPKSGKKAKVATADDEMAARKAALDESNINKMALKMYDGDDGDGPMTPKSGVGRSVRLNYGTAPPEVDPEGAARAAAARRF